VERKNNNKREGGREGGRARVEKTYRMPQKYLNDTSNSQHAICSKSTQTESDSN